ncbi:MAG: hypothetical protein ABEK10_04260 [Candidatus Nanosalina sp.]
MAMIEFDGDCVERRGEFETKDAGEIAIQALQADYSVGKLAETIDQSENYNLTDAEMVAESLKWEYGEETSELFKEESDYKFEEIEGWS